MTPTVVDEPDQHRFVVELEGSVAELVYHLEDGRLVLTHTEVPEAIGGHGIGGLLVNAAVDRAARDDLTVVPWCPFARDWLHEHQDEAAAVAIDWSSTPRQ